MSAEFLPLGMYRKRAGLTQAQLVRKTRLSRRGVQLMEKEDSIPHEENIVEYLKACGVQPEEAQLLAARLRHARGVTERRGRKPSRRGTLIALPRCGDLPDLGQDPRGWANMVLANVIATGAEAFKAEFNNNQTRVWQRRNSQWIAIASVNGQASGLPEIAMRSIRDVLGVRSHRDGRRLENNQDVKLEFRDFLGRGSFVETAAGCTLDLRLLPNKYETLADLNFPAALITRLRRCEKTANGLVLFCAPEVSDIQRSLRAFAMLAASHRRVLVITEDVGPWTLLEQQGRIEIARAFPEQLHLENRRMCESSGVIIVDMDPISDNKVLWHLMVLSLLGQICFGLRAANAASAVKRLFDPDDPVRREIGQSFSCNFHLAVARRPVKDKGVWKLATSVLGARDLARANQDFKQLHEIEERSLRLLP